MKRKKEITAEKAFKRLVNIGIIFLAMILFIFILRPNRNKEEQNRDAVLTAMDRQLDSLLIISMPEGTNVISKGQYELIVEDTREDAQLRNDIYRFEKALTETDIDTNKLAQLEKKAIEARKKLDSPKEKAYMRNIMLSVGDTIRKSCYQKTTEDLRESSFAIVYTFPTNETKTK